MTLQLFHVGASEMRAFVLGLKVGCVCLGFLKDRDEDPVAGDTSRKPKELAFAMCMRPRCIPDWSFPRELKS